MGFSFNKGGWKEEKVYQILVSEKSKFVPPLSIVVENAWFGDQEDYILWYGGDGVPVSKGKVLLEQQQGIALRMPKLEGRTCALIDAYNLKYSDS